MRVVGAAEAFAAAADSPADCTPSMPRSTLLLSCVRIAFECYLDALSSGPVNFGARASLPAASLAMRRVRGLRSSFFCSTIIIEFSLEANAVKATDTIFLKICVSFF